MHSGKCAFSDGKYNITNDFGGTLYEHIGKKTALDLMKYVDEINSTYLNVYPDCGNINNAAITYGTDVLADLKSCDGHVVAMHLKETVPGKFRDMMYGEGQVDFPAMIDTAWEMGVRRYVTEFWYLGKEDWKADLHFANSAMRKLLDQKEND